MFGPVALACGRAEVRLRRHNRPYLAIDRAQQATIGANPDARRRASVQQGVALFGSEVKNLPNCAQILPSVDFRKQSHLIEDGLCKV